ncbi:MAG: alpha/beta fold hydrolase [Thermoanaerobaculia bacterium]|nr:alpha/beta fold hydrolase [Thermoanaerobaculia bacterium]
MTHPVCVDRTRPRAPHRSYRVVGLLLRRPSRRIASISRRQPAFLTCLLCLCGLLISVAAGAGEWKLYDFQDQGGVYAWRYLPTAPTTGFDALPVVIFLHGSGSSPDAWLDFLAPAAEVADVAILAPKSDAFLSFHPGADDVTIERALERLAEEASIDPARISLAGHSAGGGHAMVMAYTRRMGVNAVFIMGSPYRTVLGVADADVTPPIRMYYGTTDPNYQSSRQALQDQWQRLGVPWELDVGIGFGHSGWPDGTLEAGFQFLKEHPYATAGGCAPTDTTLCLRDGAYAVTATWTDFDGNTGAAETATARTAESGLLTFFSDTNWELQIKVLDGCSLNDHRWVFAAGTTNVGFVLRVEEMATGAEAIYENPVGTAPEPILDTVAFTCQ